MKHCDRLITAFIVLAPLVLLLTPHAAWSRTIGPDPYGYTATDETRFDWIEIARPAGGTGTEILRSQWQGDLDDGFFEIPDIGFDFHFYGNTKRRTFICSNGFLTFDSASVEYDSQCLPHRAMPNDMVDVFWDDLDMEGIDTNVFPNDGKVFYQTIGNAPTQRFVVEYYKIPHIDDPDSRFTFEVILYPDGSIRKQYFDMQNGASNFADGRTATIGIEDNVGARALEWWCGQGAPGPVRNGTSIVYRTSITQARILVLEVTCGGSPTYVFDALNNLGPAYAYVATTWPADFIDKLRNGGPWDLVIVDMYNNALGPAGVAELGNYIAGGGRAIISHWGWHYDTGLDAFFEAQYIDNYTTPQNLFLWDPLHPIFNVPHAIHDIFDFRNRCNVDGARFNAVGGGVAIGGYTPPRIPNQHAFIIGNNNRTILNGEVFGVIRGDRNENGVSDAIDLIENEIVFLLGFPLLTEGAPARHGAPTPAGYGYALVMPDTVVSNSVNTPAYDIPGTRFVCTGWVGSGSTPASGAGNSVVFTLTEPSTLTWQWATEYYLSLQRATNATEGWKPEGFFYDLYPTDMPPPLVFDHWATNGSPAGAGIPLNIEMTEPQNVAAVYRDGFTNVTDDCIVRWTGWTTNRQTGTMFGTLQLCNSTNSPRIMTAPFWYVAQRTLFSYLMDPDGIEPHSGFPYVDLTAQILAQLPGIGNGDLVLDPGECVIVGHIEFYSRDRRPPAGYLYAVWADPPNNRSDVGNRDTDHDGIGNDWEDRFGLNKNDGKDGDSDADRDTFTALEEYRANTVPTDPRSCLRFLPSGPAGQADLWLQWVGGTSVLQYLMWSENPDGPWQTVYTNEPVTDITNLFKHHIQGRPKGFYRVTVP